MLHKLLFIQDNYKRKSVLLLELSSFSHVLKDKTWNLLGLQEYLTLPSIPSMS